MVYRKFRTRIPPAPNYHRLFGENYVKTHLIGDEHWTPQALTNQYKCMADFLAKHNELEKLQFSIKQKRQKRKVTNLKDEILKGRDKIKEAGYANNQNLRNVLQDHKEILRLCEILPMHNLTESINQKLFVKRKENDRLYFQMEQLTKEYENKLRKLSETEDQIKYKEEFRLPEEDKIKIMRMDLTNLQTRLKAVKVIRRSYIDIIQFLMQDAVYYESVLDALQKDIDEQENFIDHVLHLGLPATGKLPKLREEYKRLERKRGHKIKTRIEQLKTYRNKVTAERDEVINQLRTEVVPYSDPLRYARETPSIVDLKKELLEIETVMKKLKNATNCTQIKDVVRVIKTQVENNTRLRSVIDLFENEKNLLEEKKVVAKQVQEILNYSYTQEEIERIKKMQDLRDLITIEQKSQEELSEELKQKGEVFILLGWAISHINDTLRNFGGRIADHPSEREYPTEDLKLPLLNFDMYPKKATPPIPLETNLENLLSTTTHRVTVLMNVFNQIPAETIEKAKEMFNKNFKNNFHPKMLERKFRDEHHHHRAIFEEEEEYDDPDVVTREKIKLESAKIVEENSKKDD